MLRGVGRLFYLLLRPKLLVIAVKGLGFSLGFSVLGLGSRDRSVGSGVSLGFGV